VGDSTSAAPQVDNPMRGALITLKNSLVTEVERLKALLSTTDSDMGSKKVWVGSAADDWHAQLQHNRSRLSTLVDQIIPTVEAEIAKCPPQVPQSTAKLMNFNM
jgi:uncharacterized protein HemX